MRGNITRRGKSSWRIKFDHGFDPTTGKRRTYFETMHGSKRDAVNLLAKRAHIIPALGNIALQKLEGTEIDAFYAHLRIEGRRDGKGGLAPATIAHIHKVLTQILKSPVKARKLRHSPMDDVQTKPKARQ